MLQNSSQIEAARISDRKRETQIWADQNRLLYENANTGAAVTAVVAPVLAYLQSDVVRPGIFVPWLLYMFGVAGFRFLLTRRYWRAVPGSLHAERWTRWFAAGAALSGIGWGIAGVLLYSENDLLHQVFLSFVIGGMMLGGSSLLAPRIEAFLAFLIPAGSLPALRLLFASDAEHIAMGVLAAVFTVALLLTTWRFHWTITSSLKLQFENQNLLHELQVANNRTEALNQELENRVQKRTAELHQALVRLREESETREKMEEELVRSRKLESLAVLAGGIAHDFNNFLTVVQGNLELARMRLNAASPVMQILDQTATACQSAAFLSSQLLTFAKGGAPIRRVVSASKLILDAVHLIRAGASVSVDLEMADDLYPVHVDAGQIGQVLHNILLNAKEAMPDGGIIEVRAENMPVPGEDPGRVKIAVRDYGPGIPTDVLPRIFDPYFTTKPGGNGLGLATTYAIVSKHGGRISVVSKPGQGATFIIELPATLKAPEREIPEKAKLRPGTGKLLVMDDEESLRVLLERILTTLGYEVESSRDGAEAIALYERAKALGRGFDAVLLDLTVRGGMGGIEAAARLRELDPSARLIVSSGYSDAPVMSEFRRYGFDDVIPKPWKMAEISEIFRRVLVGDPKPENT
jgi:signal transduction histidine kinase/ActR/RegA family two-component response regulator